MKNPKIIITGFVLFCFVISMHSQTEQGKILLGGETKLAFSSLNSKWKTDDDDGDVGKLTNLEFTPIVGIFVADGLAFGIDLPITYASQKDEDDDKYSSTSIAFAAFMAIYFGTGNITPYLDAEIGFGNMKMKDEPATGTSDESSAGMFLYAIEGGLAIFLNEKVSLDIGVGYAYASMKPKEDNDNNYRGIASGIGLGMGIVIML